MNANHVGPIVFAAIPFAFVFAAACGNTVYDGSGGTGAGTSSPTSTGATTDPCAGKSCGDPCSTCPNPAPCAQQACDANGQCTVQGQFTCGGCPPSLPVSGSACSPEGIECEFATGFIVTCRPSATCLAAGWSTSVPNCPSDPPPDPKCPATMPSGNCDVMVDPSLCMYGDVPCGCSNCLTGLCGGQAQWVCAPPPPVPCPATPPELGTTCTDAGLSCIYGSCAIGQVLSGRECKGGIWIDSPVACPAG
jgi:hypothetical protein